MCALLVHVGERAEKPVDQSAWHKQAPVSQVSSCFSELALAQQIRRARRPITTGSYTEARHSSQPRRIQARSSIVRLQPPRNLSPAFEILKKMALKKSAPGKRAANKFEAVRTAKEAARR